MCRQPTKMETPDDLLYKIPENIKVGGYKCRVSTIFLSHPRPFCCSYKGHYRCREAGSSYCGRHRQRHRPRLEHPTRRGRAAHQVQAKEHRGDGARSCPGRGQERVGPLQHRRALPLQRQGARAEGAPFDGGLCGPRLARGCGTSARRE